MTNNVALTSINESARFELVRDDFGTWLKSSGASDVTVTTYLALTGKWLRSLNEDQGNRPAIVWQRSQMPESMKRLTGYACRRYRASVFEVLGEEIELGVPSRLPIGTRPNPNPISDDDLQGLHRAAKKLYPRETALSFRVWLHFMNETSCRRSESDIDWPAINWSQRSVLVRGKTGERELPLSSQMMRRLQFLFLRGGSYPWSGYRGQRLSGQVLYYLLKRAAKFIGRSELTPHLIRHRRLTKLCSSETNSLLILSFAGSSSLASLQYYYRVSLEERRRLLDLK
jgi:integrase